MLNYSMNERLSAATALLRRSASHLGIDANRLLSLLLSFLLLAQFLPLVHAVGRNTDTWPVINAQDNDAAFAIRTAERSGWFTNNRFYSYGNLYFNLAHTFASFDPGVSHGPATAMSLENDRAHHFSLMMVSLLALYGIAFLAASHLSRSWPLRLLTVLALVSVLASGPAWMRWVLRAHPDLLFSFLLALSLGLTIRFLQTGLDGYRYGSAAAWGFALGTKLTAVLFLPGLLLLFLPPATRTALANAARYYVVILLSYLIIGFPQNFRFFGHFRFLKHQSSLSVAPTALSMLETLSNLAWQAFPAVTAVILLRLVANLTESDAPRPVPAAALAKALGITATPLVVLLAQRVLTEHEHYTLPIAACLFIISALAACSFLRFERLAIASPGRRLAVLLAATAAVLFLIRSLPGAMPGVLAEQARGRTEARSFIDEIGRYQRQGLVILADPYVPWDANLGGVSESFFRSPADLADGKAAVVALAKGYYQRYLEDPPSRYVQKDVPGWRSVRDYYRIFAGRDRTTDPFGRSWVKMSSHQGGWELWKREK